EISALKGTGVKRCAKKAVELARNNKCVPTVHHSFDDRVESAIHFISALLPDGTDMLHKRYFATKIFERDKLVVEDFKDFDDVESLIKDVERFYDDDSESIIADQRYKYITSCIDECRTKSGKTPISEKIDSVITNKYLSLPIFALIMFGVYYISVSTLGGALAGLIEENIFGENGIPFITENFLNRINCAPWLTSLIVDGIIAGVGAVLTFVPQIIVLFIFLSFLEDCGYMSRIAFIMDKLFRKFGLSGKSFIPILVGTGCGVPGIMSSRTIENVNERRMTIITTTFIPCGAKLPVIALIASALFGKAWWVAPSAYFIGIASIISSGILLKKTKIFSGDVSPFVMELPSYHMPTAKSVFRATWDRTWSYVKKAGTIILLASCGVWLLSNFGFYNGRFGMVQQMDNSVLAYIGNFLKSIFTPLGFGTWQASVATLLGLAAKEEIVGVFGVLYDNIGEGFTALSGYSFLIFNLLCAPCVA
ncbi:MAG: ferrous iron transport protein B, partial [Eubacterium sp.]|nr:ferrous iron transport protein B [Eubacterium sp.]